MDPTKPPIIPFPVSPEDRLGLEDTERDEGRADGLPEHEIDEDTSIGGGILGQGGTAIDRGTGTTDGQAQGSPPDGEAGLAEKVIPNPRMPA